MAPKKKNSQGSKAGGGGGQVVAAAAPAAAAAAGPKNAAAPRPLTPRARALLLLALPLTIAGFAVGALGMLVLVAPDHPLVEDTPFASAWRTVLTKNLFVQPFLFNFGAIASVGVAMRLAEDRRAALEAAAAAGSGRKKRR